MINLNNGTFNALKYNEKKFLPVPGIALTYSNRTDSLGNNIYVDLIYGEGKKGFLVLRVGQYAKHIGLFKCYQFN